MATLQSWAWPPAPTVTSVWPLGLNATAPASAPGPSTVIGAPISCWVATFQIRAVPSAPSVASSVPSGLNATAR